MNLKDHKKYLSDLIEINRQGSRLSDYIPRAIPKTEGAFYFGHAIDMDEYIRKYTLEVVALEASEEAEAEEIEEIEEDE